MKRRVYFIFILLLSLAVIPVGAKTNNFYADNNLSLTNPIDSTTFIAGNNVELSSEIDGMSFVAGEYLKISSKQDHLFAAGNNIDLEGVDTKEAFIAGNSIDVNASRARDLYIAASTIRINKGNYRNAYIGGENVVINSTFSGDVNLSASNIRIGKEAVIEGKLKYPEDAEISIANTAVINEEEVYSDISYDSTNIFIEELKSIIYSFLAMLVFGLILIAINTKEFNKISKMKKDSNNILKTIGIGFCCLVLVPVAAIIALITIIGIPISVVSLMVYGILIYLSAVAVAYFLGDWLLKDKIKNKYLKFTIALAVIYILRLIPIVGGLILFLTICFGLGIYITLIKDHITAKK